MVQGGGIGLVVGGVGVSFGVGPGIVPEGLLLFFNPADFKIENSGLF